MSAAATTDPLAQVRQALRDPNASLRLVRIVFGPARWGVQVYVKSRKVGPLLLPPTGGTMLDLLSMIDDLASEPAAVA